LPLCASGFFMGGVPAVVARRLGKSFG